MKTIGSSGFDAKTTAMNAAWRSRALEKPKATADLHGKGQDEPHQQPAHNCKFHASVSSQNGTGTTVPFRYAPRLTAAFTAQLLGQILPDPERPSARVYGGERFAALPDFDAKI